MGMILLLLSLAGVLSALWVAWALRSELSELSRQELRLEQLQAENGTLMEQRDGLSSRERIEMKAAELGLFPPRSNQLR